MQDREVRNYVISHVLFWWSSKTRATKETAAVRANGKSGQFLEKLALP